MAEIGFASKFVNPLQCLHSENWASVPFIFYRFYWITS